MGGHRAGIDQDQKSDREHGFKSLIKKCAKSAVRGKFDFRSSPHWGAIYQAPCSRT
jgi:hypothetical protein